MHHFFGDGSFFFSFFNRLHIQDGFIPVLYWSAETHLEHSHKSSVEDIQWLPPDVWFSTESAYPKQNPNSQLRQLISCASDNFIYVWDLTNDDSRDSAERKRIIDGEKVGEYGKTISCKNFILIIKVVK